MEVEPIKSEILHESFTDKYIGYFNKNKYHAIYWYLLGFYTCASTSVLVLVDYA